MGTDNIILKELRERETKEIHVLLKEKAKDLYDIKFKHALGQLRETHKLNSIKKDIARLNVLIRERKLL